MPASEIANISGEVSHDKEVDDHLEEWNEILLDLKMIGVHLLFLTEICHGDAEYGYSLQEN